MKSLALPIADLHEGLKVALMPPKVVDNTGGTYRPSLAQKVIYKMWKKCRNEIINMLETGFVDELILFLMGDIVHGNRKSEEVYSTSLRTQADAAITLLGPLANRASKTYFVRGTRYHKDDDGMLEDTISRELGCFGLKSYMKMEVDVQGVRFMLQHKGPRPGSRQWTKGNGLRHFLINAHIDAAKRGKIASDIYLWAHFHEYRREAVVEEYGGSFNKAKGYTLPAWCAANEFALANVGHLELSHIGNIYFIVEDGVAKSHRQFKRFDNVVRVKHE